MATIQKQSFNRDNIVDNHLWLIDQIREETLDAIANYFKNMNVPFGYLPDFLKNPDLYPGNKITGLKDIIERFLNLSISKYYFKIQAEGLPIKFVINTIRENLFQGGWDINRYSNITMATRGDDDARKAVSASRIDEPSLSLLLKNKGYKAKAKPKKRSPKVKTIKNVKIKAPVKCKRSDKLNQCDYCGVYIKIRYTSNFIHVNICQNPKTHHFCSKECKTNWISTLLEKKVKLLEVRI